MGIGMLATGLMIALPMIAPRVWSSYGGDARALRFLLCLHRDVTYAALLLILIHIVGLVFIDRTTIEYLKLSAPWSMLAATASAVLLLVLTVSSRYRIDLGVRYRGWRIWHVGMSVVAMACMAYHIVDAGYYLNSPIKKAVFIALVAGPSLASFGVSRWHGMFGAAALDSSRRPTLRLPSARAFSVRLVVLLGMFWLVWMISFAIPKAGSRGDEQASYCAISACD